MIYLNKILPFFISPIFFIILLMLIGVFLNSKRISIFTLIITITLSMPFVSNNLIHFLERDYRLEKIDLMPDADAIVVLSGMVRTINAKEGLHYEWTDASDRIFAGIELVKKGKSPRLVLTQGKLPWSLGEPEGSFLKKIAMDQGVDAEKIILTGKVENTEQEAFQTARLLVKSNPTIILVTSAFHMPRAKQVFEAAGLNVEPFAVDFRQETRELTVVDFIPTAEALKDTSFFVREMAGRIFYALKY
jgi:uncharacterized SAM-binding protein YcdF (DUF218 family)